MKYIKFSKKKKKKRKETKIVIETKLNAQIYK